MSIQDSFISHLIELRDRLLRAIVAVLIVLACMAPWANKIYQLLAAPMLAKLPAGGHMLATSVTTPFFVPLKVAALAAFVVALPYVLFQAWAFIAPGLYVREKKLVGPLIVATTLLFVVGMAFAYFLVFPVVFGFMAGVSPEGVTFAPDIEQYLNFVITMFLAFGVTFEVPIVVILLVRMGIVDIAKLKEIRPYVIVGAFVIAAIFTPPDVVSQLLLAIPMCVLYELGILIARFMGRGDVAIAPEETL